MEIHHQFIQNGREAKRAIKNARDKVSKTINAKQSEIYFTSCGSESDNLAIKGIAYKNKNKGKHIITTRIEHPAVLNTCKALEKEGYEVTYLDVDANGLIDLKDLEKSVREDTILISIMFANNEVGTIQPIKQIGQIAKEHNIIFHTDSVQAIGNIRIDVKEMQIDLLSMSSHKFYGPKGVGVLYVREGVEFERLQDGGHQEKNKRAGTENVAGIVGTGEAISLIYKEFEKHNKKLMFLRNYFIQELNRKNFVFKINGDMKKRLSGNINISFIGIDSEELLYRLDEFGICASGGSACSTRRSKSITCINCNEQNKRRNVKCNKIYIWDGKHKRRYRFFDKSFK